MNARIRWTLVALTLAGTAAASFSVADLHGTYGLQGGREWKAEAGANCDASPFPSDHLGTVEFDGAGNVIGGVRTFRVPPLELGQSSTFVRQVAISGTYTVASDGTGTITITWDPPLPPLPGDPTGADALYEVIRPATDRMDFALQGNGFAYWDVIHGSVRWRTDIYSPWHTDPGRDYTWTGEARLIESPCHPFVSGFARRTGQ